MQAWSESQGESLLKAICVAEGGGGGGRGRGRGRGGGGGLNS